MSNIVLANAQIPAHLAARVGVPSALSQSLASGIGGGGESVPRISIKGARFRIIEGGTETVLDSTSLDVVIVGANPKLSKTWYAKAWTPEAEPSSPDCFSLDGVGPDSQATQPQNDLCASCPQNAWGSKITPQGKQIKACSDLKRLAVVAADDPTGPTYLLAVTPAALAGLSQYHKDLSVRGIPAEIVRTKVSFDTNASFPKLTFNFGGFLDADTQSEVDKLFGTDAVKDITGEARQGQPVAVPQVASRPAPVAAAPQPAPTPVAEAQPEAAPKRGFGAPKAAPAAAAPAQAKAKPAPVAAAPAAAASVSLADEIAALVGEVNADDA
jgi:hypothetical protein